MNLSLMFAQWRVEVAHLGADRGRKIDLQPKISLQPTCILIGATVFYLWTIPDLVLIFDSMTLSFRHRGVLIKAKTYTWV